MEVEDSHVQFVEGLKKMMIELNGVWKVYLLVFIRNELMSGIITKDEYEYILGEKQ